MKKTPETTELLRVLEIQADALWATCGCVGSATPFQKNLAVRMEHPRSGDLVRETSTACWPREDRSVWDRIGYLEKQVQEPMFRGSQLIAGEITFEDLASTERVWYIRTLDDRRYRWTNAAFLTVITERAR